MELAGPGPRLAAVGEKLLPTTVFLICHLRNDEELLVVVNLRGQLKDPLKNLLITVWRLQIARLQGAAFQCKREWGGKGWDEISFCSVNVTSLQKKTDDNPAMHRKKERKEEKNTNNQNQTLSGV